MEVDRNLLAEMLNVRQALRSCLNGDENLVEEKATLIRELQKSMPGQIVHFVFRKKDGTLRHAFGTRAADVIREYSPLPESGGKMREKKAPAFGTFPYFDIERRDWRCFRVELIVEIKNDYTI